MIRTLRLSDIPRQFLSTRLKSSDLLSTYSKMSRKRSNPPNLARWTLPFIKDRIALGSFHDNQLHAMVLLKARQRSSVWEVSHAFCTPLGYNDMEELLTTSIRMATASGADRVFLRYENSSPADEPAKRAGFREAYTEDLMIGSIRPSKFKPLELQKLQHSDLSGVYGLHSSVAPLNMKFAIGMTFEQWFATREDSEGYIQEYVFTEGLVTVVWLHINWQRNSIIADAILHPEYKLSVDALIEAAYRIIGYQKQVYWIVRSHESIIANALIEKGWRIDSSFTVLVKPVAKFVQQTSMLPIQV